MRQDQINSIYENCYVINLERRIDRKVKIIDNFKGSKFNLKIMKGIDGSKLPREGKLSGPEIGCLLSHVGVIEKAKEDGAPCVLVMEDDVIVKDMNLLYDRIEEFKKHVDEDFDMIYLCGQFGVKNQYYTSKHVGDHVYTYREGMGGCIAYIVNSRIYDDIINNFKNNRLFPIDTLYCTFLSDVGPHKGILGRDAKYYCSYKFPVQTYSNKSDICGYVRNDDHLNAYYA